MTEVLFFFGVWFALSWVGALLMGQVLHNWPDDEEEEEPVVNFHQRRQEQRHRDEDDGLTYGDPRDERDERARA